MQFGSASVALLCILCPELTSLSSAYQLIDDKCVAEDGNPPGRLINGFYAPNATANPEIGQGPNPCGCDPKINESLYQVNLRRGKACPMNAEPLFDLLAGEKLQGEPFLKRNHGAIPLLLSEDDYVLEVGGNVERPFNLSLKDLRAAYVHHKVEALTCCAGNRRSEFRVRKCPSPVGAKGVDGIPWGAGSLSNAVWEGPLVADILRIAKPLPGSRYVEFEGADITKEEEEEGFDKSRGYAAAIKLRHVMDESNRVILALERNGHTLERFHGYPVRSVVPGYMGGRSVKWLVKIVVLKKPSESYFMAVDYKLYSPSLTNVAARALQAESVPKLLELASKYPPLDDLNVQAAILKPVPVKSNANLFPNRAGQAVAVVPAGQKINVSGYAFSGGGRHVQGVYLCHLDVYEPESACDVADRWIEVGPENIYPHPAREAERIAEDGIGFYGWSTWHKEIEPLYSVDDIADATTTNELTTGKIIVRAVDTAANSMPADMCPIYNWRGVYNNAWFKVQYVAVPMHMATVECLDGLAVETSSGRRHGLQR